MRAQVFKLASPLSFAVDDVEDKDWIKMVQVLNHPECIHVILVMMQNLHYSISADLRAIQFVLSGDTAVFFVFCCMLQHSS